MRKEEISSDLSNLAFDFFFLFSRFEFALKENDYLKSHEPGTKAEPGWREFEEKWASHYILSAEACLLLKASPERQVVGAREKLEWRPVGLDDCKSDLAKVIRLVATVRNNLFHGGKHGCASWDNPDRTRELLTTSSAVLSQLAQLASIEADFLRYY